MGYESYHEEKLRLAKEAVAQQERAVYRAQTVLGKLRLEVQLIEIEMEEERSGGTNERA